MTDLIDPRCQENSEQAFRQLLERFARVRAAHRALPDSAEGLSEAEERGRFASGVRKRLTHLDSLLKSREASASDLDSAVAEAGREVEIMETEVLARIDHTSFGALRASIPASAEDHRAEVISLLEIIALGRDGLLQRLSKLEYLLTILCTEESEGQRRVVHDPVSITPVLADVFSQVDDGQSSDGSLGEVVVEIYQAASVDDLGQDPKAQLRQVRLRKDALGVSRLMPDVMRAVLTYNTRIFNIFSNAKEPGRASDAWIEQLLGEVPDETAEDWQDDLDSLDGMEDLWERIGIEEAPDSVFESNGIASVIDALGRRLRQIPIGSCASERIALALDISRLEDAERKMLLEKECDEDTRLVQCTVVVGLMLRDLGAVSSYLDEVGICGNALSRHWVLELNERFRTLLSAKVGNAEQYAEASTLSGIKTKHLLAPVAALKESRKVIAPALENSTHLKSMVRESRTSPGSRSPRQVGSAKSTDDAPGEVLRSLSQYRGALAACAVLLIVMLVSWASAPEPSVSTLSKKSLSSTSPYLESAYRNEQGNGAMMFGKLEASFLNLSEEERLAAAEAMVPKLASAGVREAMLYDRAGVMQVHYSSGVLRKPR